MVMLSDSMWNQSDRLKADTAVETQESLKKQKKREANAFTTASSNASFVSRLCFNDTSEWTKTCKKKTHKRHTTCSGDVFEPHMQSAKKGKGAARDRLHHILQGEQQNSKAFTWKLIPPSVLCSKALRQRPPKWRRKQSTNRSNSILKSCKTNLCIVKEKNKCLNGCNLPPFADLTSWTVRPRLTSNPEVHNCWAACASQDLELCLI